ncbi:hypothetical protein B296_00005570 [Ensete ventricosum]|uniref:Uncharacterized protein n=1 Tax=Ensete ventricosum TaxID=4639 RepID=A0A427AEX8_ENSVE|nr:hypothetical protein B296_00005570 [Ensete ventricosum]
MLKCTARKHIGSVEVQLLGALWPAKFGYIDAEDWVCPGLNSNRIEARVLIHLEMKEIHNCSFVVTLLQLEELCNHFRVLSEFILFILKGEVCPFHQFSKGFYLLVDVVEAGLCLFSL